MKNRIIRAFALSMAVLAGAMPLSAKEHGLDYVASSDYDFQVDGIYYGICESVTEFGVPIGYEGSVEVRNIHRCEKVDSYSEYDLFGMETSVWQHIKYLWKGNDYAGDITINSMVEYDGKRYLVERIAEGAFANCTELTSVIIYAQFFEIGIGAFKDCKNLKSINIQAERYIIRKGAFYGCESLSAISLYYAAYVGDFSFSGCTGLKSICMPNISCPEGAFLDCPNIERIYACAIASTDKMRYMFDRYVFENATYYVPCDFVDEYSKFADERYAFKDIRPWAYDGQWCPNLDDMEEAVATPRGIRATGFPGGMEVSTGAGRPVDVFTADGRLLMASKADADGYCRIHLAPGTYVAVSDGASAKVVVR